MFDATPIARLYAHWRLSRMNALDPAKTQANELARLLRRARNTRFGRDHGFDRIDSPEAFQRAVPLRSYEAFWEGYWKDAFPGMKDATWPGATRYLAESSGTSSGKTKFIPVTDEMLASNQRAALTMTALHLAGMPGGCMLGGRNFMLGGSVAMKQYDGVLSGDLSGIAAREVPLWASPFYYPPRDLAEIGDWEEKTAALARESVKQDIRAMGATTSWLLLFFDSLRQFHGKPDGKLKDFYPNLEMVVVGGVALEPYRERLLDYIGDADIDLREVYPASEGFLAISDRGIGEGLRLLLDNGLFYEFVPLEELEAENPTRHWIGNVETGINYAVVLSTCAGLWAYILGDTVRFVDLDPPRLLVTGRVSYYLSAFGEHVIDEELEKAATAAAEAAGASIADFSVAALYPDGERPRGCHLWLIEFTEERGRDALTRAAEAIDTTLSALNLDYKAHRAGGFGMDPPLIEQLPAGGFARWMKTRGKLGGQNKVPRVISNPELLQSLREMAETAPVQQAQE